MLINLNIKNKCFLTLHIKQLNFFIFQTNILIFIYKNILKVLSSFIHKNKSELNKIIKFNAYGIRTRVNAVKRHRLNLARRKRL